VVRYELRDLPEDDREKYFAALHTFYFLGQEEGEKLYGSTYKSLGYLVREHLYGAADKVQAGGKCRAGDGVCVCVCFFLSFYFFLCGAADKVQAELVMIRSLMLPLSHPTLSFSPPSHTFSCA